MALFKVIRAFQHGGCQGHSGRYWRLHHATPVAPTQETNQEPLVASLLLVAMPFAPSGVRSLLVAGVCAYNACPTCGTPKRFRMFSIAYQEMISSGDDK